MSFPGQLTPAAKAVALNLSNRLYVGVGSMWEIAIKVSLGKLTLTHAYRPWFEGAIRDLNLTLLPITLDYADEQTRLPWHHKDPFDRLLVAQAIVERIPIVSSDPALDQYGITRIWN